MNAAPAAATAATPGSRPGAAASLTRAAKLAAGHDHAEGTANQSLAAIRGAIRAWARLSCTRSAGTDVDRADGPG